MPLSVPSRLAYWKKLHDRLHKLSNRVDAATILAAVHERIPMVTLDEQRELQLANAEADERFWSIMQDMNEEQVNGHKGLVTLAEKVIAKAQGEAREAAANAAAVKERIERLRKGEDVQGGFSRITSEQIESILKSHGVDPRHCRNIHALEERGLTDEYREAVSKATRSAEKAIAKKMLRR